MHGRAPLTCDVGGQLLLCCLLHVCQHVVPAPQGENSRAAAPHAAHHCKHTILGCGRCSCCSCCCCVVAAAACCHSRCCCWWCWLVGSQQHYARGGHAQIVAAPSDSTCSIVQQHSTAQHRTAASSAGCGLAWTLRAVAAAYSCQAPTHFQHSATLAHNAWRSSASARGAAAEDECVQCADAHAPEHALLLLLLRLGTGSLIPCYLLSPATAYLQ